MLSSHEHCRVVAVDPGALNEDVASRPNVVHLRMLLSEAQATVDQVTAALAPADHADIVVCDANIPPASAARLVAHLGACGLLADGAAVVLTLKSPLRVRHGQADSVREGQLEEASRALGGRFGEASVKHLFANSQHECTLCAIYWGTVASVERDKYASR